MKRSFLKFLLGGVAALILTMPLGVSAKVDGQLEAVRKALRAVPAPEIPDKAASLVAQAKPEQRQTLAVSVMQAAVGLAPGTAAEITAAIARKTPSTAPAVAAAAAELQPKAAPVIARAAAAAAPAYAGEIVSAICKRLPAQYSDVAVQVAAVVPNASQQIIDGLLRALPTLRPFVERAIVIATSGSSYLPPIQQTMPITKALVHRASTRFSVSTDQILTDGITAAQDSQLTADLAVQPLDSGVIFVPGGGKSFEHRAQSPIVEKGTGRIGSYSPP